MANVGLDAKVFLKRGQIGQRNMRLWVLDISSPAEFFSPKIGRQSCLELGGSYLILTDSIELFGHSVRLIEICDPHFILNRLIG